MATPTTGDPARDDIEYLRLTATRVSFEGASIQGRRLVPDEGFTLAEDRERRVAYLRTRGGDLQATISCSCALQGGSCDVAVVNPGAIDEYAVCVPLVDCGDSGLFCFIDTAFVSGPTVRIQM